MPPRRRISGSSPRSTERAPPEPEPEPEPLPLPQPAAGPPPLRMPQPGELGAPEHPFWSATDAELEEQLAQLQAKLQEAEQQVAAHSSSSPAAGARAASWWL